MAGQSWVITISGKSPNAIFTPDVYGYLPDSGRPLRAQLGDLVNWNNQTTDVHKIELADQNFVGLKQYLTSDIQDYSSSSPGYVPQIEDIRPPIKELGNIQTIYYICAKHTGEHGQISVVD